MTNTTFPNQNDDLPANESEVQDEATGLVTAMFQKHLDLEAQPVQGDSPRDSNGPSPALELMHRRHQETLASSKLMLVNDPATDVEDLRSQLKDIGFENVETSVDAAEIPDCLHSLTPDIVILDNSAPGSVGLVVLEAIRSDARFQKLPVVVLVDPNDSSQKQEAYALGANDYLTFPLCPNESVLRVQNVLAANAHEDQLSKLAEREPRYKILKSDRLDVFIEVMFEGELICEDVELIDISVHGTKFVTSRSLPKGTIVDLTIRAVELGLNVTISSEIRWVQLRSSGKSHLGCSFMVALPLETYMELARGGYLDRRLDPRRRVSLDATVKQELTTKRPEPVVILDYSSGGMLLSCYNSKKLGERLLVELADDNGNVAVIPIKSVWQRENDGQFNVGCSFLNNEGYESLQKILRSRNLVEVKRPIKRVESSRPFQMAPVWWIGMCTVYAWFLIHTCWRLDVSQDSWMRNLLDYLGL